VSEGELLTGDGVTQGIVRIGDTVRRPPRPFSLTVQAYLAHLQDAGFTGAPAPFGADERGREMLSFVPGDVPRNPLPPETASTSSPAVSGAFARRTDPRLAVGEAVVRHGPGCRRAPVGGVKLRRSVSSVQPSPCCLGRACGRR
jgi:hypothetical protein